MQNNERMCTVTNRSGSEVIYNLPDRRLRRAFLPRETKKIAYSELEELVSQPGGREAIYNYFLIQESGVVEELTNKKPEIEYYFTDETINGWLNSCSLDEFKDALDFAPEGTIELIKDHSVSLPLRDMLKQEALKQKFGFDCAQAIKNERDTLADDDGDEIQEAPKRRVAPTNAEQATRRVLPKYNVVKREGE